MERAPDLLNAGDGRCASSAIGLTQREPYQIETWYDRRQAKEM